MTRSSFVKSLDWINFCVRSFSDDSEGVDKGFVCWALAQPFFLKLSVFDKTSYAKSVCNKIGYKLGLKFVLMFYNHISAGFPHYVRE